ncbi:unnamed protein product [Oppiella nova]|uniref:Amidase domain-containing protein n=1 Tax=Oppiella nova TaxID=334625 RepID=A0A7R9MIP5_9ACAR|nr:unnamed protein product [Oppiella nova]CAG2178108.1 unnamed protein product [Oppiella nova]
MPWTSGLYARKGITAPVDSEVITRLRDAGAIFIGLTNVPELIMWWHSTNILYGRTNNPYDRSRIPGGSSGGECALIASGGSLIGIGSDIGGSIREPSYFCGIFGHKTTNGIVSTKGIYPMFGESKQSFCRYAVDLKPMLKVMSGSNASKLKLDKTVDFNTIKVYYMEGHNNPGISPLQPEVRQSLNQCVDYLRNKCRDCERIYLKELELGFDIWMCAMTDPTAPALEQELANLKGRINPYVELVKSLLGVSNITFPSIISSFDDLITGLSSEQYFKFLTKLRLELSEKLHKILGDDGVFVYPGHPETAPKHNGTVLKVKNISYTCVFNTLDVAITSVPLGLSNDGLPIGVQIITNPFNDHLSIAVAEELERGFGGWTPPAAIIC